MIIEFLKFINIFRRPLSNHFSSHMGDLWGMCWDHANLDYSLALIMNGKTRWNIANH